MFCKFTLGNVLPIHISQYTKLKEILKNGEDQTIFLWFLRLVAEMNACMND